MVLNTLHALTPLILRLYLQNGCWYHLPILNKETETVLLEPGAEVRSESMFLPGPAGVTLDLLAPPGPFLIHCPLTPREYVNAGSFMVK